MNHDVDCHHLARVGATDELLSLLKSGKTGVNLKDRFGNSLLSIACNKGHYEAVNMLLQNGADIATPASNGWSPLHSASEIGHIDICALLLKRGMSINTQNRNGSSPLHLSAYNGHCGTIQYLISQGSSVNDLTFHGDTPLHLSCNRGHIDACARLLQSRADTNISNHLGRTALHIASSLNFKEICLLLLSYGADYNQKDMNDKSALDYSGLEVLRLEMHENEQELEEVSDSTNNLKLLINSNETEEEEFEEINEDTYSCNHEEVHQEFNLTSESVLLSTHKDNKTNEDNRLFTQRSPPPTHKPPSFPSSFTHYKINPAMTTPNDETTVMVFGYRNVTIHNPIDDQMISNLYKGSTTYDNICIILPMKKKLSFQSNKTLPRRINAQKIIRKTFMIRRNKIIHLDEIRHSSTVNNNNDLLNNTRNSSSDLEMREFQTVLKDIVDDCGCEDLTLPTEISTSPTNKNNTPLQVTNPMYREHMPLTE